MDVFKVCLEEISLSGLEGCTIAELWFHLATHKPALTLSLDDAMKSYLWGLIVNSIGSSTATSSVSMLTNPRPREPPATEPVTGPINPFNYRSISETKDGNLVRGSCENYEQRIDVTMEISREKPSLAAVQERYGHSLVMVGHQELRERVLFPGGVSPLIELPPIQYCLLEAVGQARHRGIARPYITSKYLKIDARCTFFYVKKMVKKGLIIIKNTHTTAYDNRTVATLYLVSYEKVIPPELPDIRAQFCDMLSVMPYQTKLVKDIYEEMGKKFKHIKKELVGSGNIEVVLMKDVAEEFAADPDIADLHGYRLLTPWAKKTPDDEFEEETEDSQLKTPLVAELPLMMQGYRAIESKGPEGIRQSAFISRTGLDLGYYSNRGIVRNLIRKSKVLGITDGETAVRTISLVAATHAQSNLSYQKLQAEAAKSSEVDQMPVTSGPNYYPPDKRYNRVRNKKPSKKSPVKKEDPEIHVAPVSEGTMMEVVDSLVSQLEESIQESQLSNISSHTSSFPVPNSLPEPPTLADTAVKKNYKSGFGIKTAIQLKRTRLILEFFDEHRTQSTLSYVTKHLRDVELEDGKETVIDVKTVKKAVTALISEGKLCEKKVVLCSDDNGQTSDLPSVTQTISLWCAQNVTEEELTAAQNASLSSFKAYLFRKQARANPKNKHKKKDSQALETDDSAEEMTNIPDNGSSAKFQRLRHFHCYLWLLAYGRGDDDTSALSKTNFPWASLVSQLPTSRKGPGWLSYNDIVNYLPFSLYLLLVRITCGKVPVRFVQYFQDPEVINGTLLCDLPAEVKASLFHKQDMIQKGWRVAMQYCTLLEDLNLVSLVGHQNPKDRSQCYVQLVQETCIIDTSNCAPRRSFFLNEARSQFKELRMQLTSVANVIRYWFDLQTVCLKTPIVLVDRQGLPETTLVNTDSHALLYNKAELFNKPEVAKEYNAKGFGAGGVPPLMFSHSNRNWSGVYNPYHPRVKRGGTELKVPHVKKRKVVKVPSSQVTRNDGGRGRERIRMKKAVKTARKVKQQKILTKRYKLFDEVSKVIEDDVVYVRGVVKTVDTRTAWTNETRNLVLSCYLACWLLHYKGGPRVTYTQIRDSISQHFPSKKDISLTALKRYMSIVIRKIKHTLEIRITECLHELDNISLGIDYPEISYEGLLDFVLNKSVSSRQLISPQLLPASLEELESNYSIIGAPKLTKATTLPVVVEEREVNRALIADLIVATLSATDTSYDQYTTFKVFESFLEVDIKSAVELFRSLQFIKRNRPKQLGIPCVQGPLNTQSYTMNHLFYLKLAGHYSPRLIGDMDQFLSYLCGGFSDSAPWPGVEQSDSVLRIHGDKASAIVAASLLEAVTMTHILVDVRSVLPDKLFEDLATPDAWEDEASEMHAEASEMRVEDLDGQSDGEEESRDESEHMQFMMKKMRTLRGGISALFGVGQGAVQYGHVDVYPVISDGELFKDAQSEQDGLPEQSTKNKENFWQSISEPTIVSRTTLEQFLKIAEENLSFNSSDLQYSKELYQLINQSGNTGVPKSVLISSCLLADLPSSQNLDDQLQAMLNFNTIFLVGITEDRFVTAEHSDKWNMSSDHSCHHTPYRPWSAVSAPHLNTELAEQYQHGVLVHIMTNPGITLLDLHEHFYPTIRLNGLRDILQVLELSNKIKCYKMCASKQCVLFNDSEGDKSELLYYEPVVT